MVVGVSADAQEVQDRFAQSLDLPYPLVGNPDGSIAQAYGVRWPVVGTFRRSTFVIGPEGQLKGAYRGEFKPAAHAAWALQTVRGRPSR